jgi:hypothetical protein
MVNWKNASSGDQKILKAVEIILKRYPWLIDQIFHPTEASLKISPLALLRGRSRGERVLIGLAIDMWNERVGVKVTDLQDLDDDNFDNVMSALNYLRAVK